MKVTLLTIASWLAASPAAGLPQAAVKQVKQGVTVFNDRVTAHFLPMRKQTVSPASIHPSLPRRNTPTRLRNVYDVYYIIDLVVGNQTIPVSVDTGSSDTWLVQEPYECVSFWVDYPGGVSQAATMRTTSERRTDTWLETQLRPRRRLQRQPLGRDNPRHPALPPILRRRHLCQGLLWPRGGQHRRDHSPQPAHRHRQLHLLAGRWSNLGSAGPGVPLSNQPRWIGREPAAV